MKIVQNIILLFIIFLAADSNNIWAEEKPMIFPIPLHTEITGGNFIVDETTVILLPGTENKDGALITELLQAEFSDKFGMPINVLRTNLLPNDRKFILIGSIKNPLIKKYCEDNYLKKKISEFGEEDYILSVKNNNIVVAAKNKKGVLYGFQSLRQLLKKEKNKILVPKLYIEDKPLYPFRGIKLFLPGRDNIPFFKRFVKDFLVKYKFNTVIIELNANMRLESHPELNIGTVKFGQDLNCSRRGRPAGPHGEYQNSAHHDNADGQILEKREVADLVEYLRKFNVEVIPEIPSLTHSYYLLFGHKNFAELPHSEYPDTYCPLKPEIYKIYFDVLNEYIEVIHPKIIHVGHDEWRMEKDVCELCKGKDYGKLFADDINKIHKFLAGKNIRMAIWGDHLLESVRKKEYRIWKTKSGYEYKIPGALTSEQVMKLIPKDILIFNWFWNKTKDEGPENDIKISGFGFEQVYGNLRPDIKKWKERKNIKGVLGGAPSSWAGTTESNFGKDLMYDFLGCANLLWSEHQQTPEQIAFISQALMPGIKEEMSGEVLPSKFNLPISYINLEGTNNSTLQNGIDSLDAYDLLKGEIEKNGKKFNIASVAKRATVVYSVEDKNKTKTSGGIKIGKDVCSLLFLHACAKEAVNGKAYRAIYNFDETAELLGWYEVVYKDGFVTTIPIRYGKNILDWNVRNRIINNIKGKTKYGQNKYAYEAEAVTVSDNKANPVIFFAYEWKNARPGKVIEKVYLKSVDYRRGHDNAVILLALSSVDIKKKEVAKGKESE